MIYKWQHLTTKEFGELDKEKAWTVLPIGSTEQHGPHLPVATDALLLQGILDQTLERLKPRVPFLALPPMYFGKSLEHTSFPGTITLSAHTLLYVLSDVVSSLSAHGFRQVIIVNSHGGNAPLIDGYLHDLQRIHHVEAYAIHLTNIYKQAEVVFKDLTLRASHACAVETSLMLHLYPDLVRKEWIPEGRPEIVKGLERIVSLRGKASWGWLTEEVAANGVIGEPHLSSAAAGARLAEWISGQLCDAILAVMNG
jgi:creatinine amidohydrolase